MTIEEKCRAIYKGDVLAGSFYLFLGFFFLIIGILLQKYVITLGFKYLGLGLIIFSILAIGKGFAMMYLYNSRLNFYKRVANLSLSLIKEEQEYTTYRLMKKSKNRRAYIYITIFGMVGSVLGIFSDSKSIIMGTLIPIALFSGIEFCISLLTEFRLWEYNRHLEKTQT
jgi:hypothetical protein